MTNPPDPGPALRERLAGVLAQLRHGGLLAPQIRALEAAIRELDAAAGLRSGVLHQRIQMAILCAEQDMKVNPQFVGGLQPIVTMLREVIEGDVPTSPGYWLWMPNGAEGGVPAPPAEPCDHAWVPIWERHESIGRQCWRCGMRVLNGEAAPPVTIGYTETRAQTGEPLLHPAPPAETRETQMHALILAEMSKRERHIGDSYAETAPDTAREYHARADALIAGARALAEEGGVPAPPKEQQQ